MTHAQHTPGPWTVNSLTRIEGPANGLIASVRGSLDEGRTHANARLIAAAPELLAALEDAFAFLRGGLDIPEAELQGRLGAAITKAKGA